ncbi:DUF4865 family protein [Streptomyces sp. NPDC059785]|uniref:DUF4865 family protein n=1 Tax=unclassified Streptomyces TaxID=2593676 RepID=UPI003648F682
MHAMQYEITLPADYDMGVIRDRVARRGHALDDWDGLALKAYLMRERGVAGSPVNQYAPFYLWHTPEGMNSFLWGGPFQGIVDDFGRPLVQHWSGLAYEEGAASGGPAEVAVRRREYVPVGVPVSEVMADAVRDVARTAAMVGAVCAGAAVDVRTWELVHFSLWDHERPKAAGELFRVLHLSQPGRYLLPRGRQW